MDSFNSMNEGRNCKFYMKIQTKKKEEKLGHVSRAERGRLLSGQQSSTSSRLLYDGLSSFLGSARSSALRPRK